MRSIVLDQQRSDKCGSSAPVGVLPAPGIVRDVGTDAVQRSFGADDAFVVIDLNAPTTLLSGIAGCGVLPIA